MLTLIFYLFIFFFQKVNDELVQALFADDSVDVEIRKSAVILVLCGWSQGQGAHLRYIYTLFKIWYTVLILVQLLQ